MVENLITLVGRIVKQKIVAGRNKHFVDLKKVIDATDFFIWLMTSMFFAPALNKHFSCNVEKTGN